MSDTYDFSDSSPQEALTELQTMLEEARLGEDSIDITINTKDNYAVNESLLKFIESEDLFHDIELGGTIILTLE